MTFQPSNLIKTNWLIYTDFYVRFYKLANTPQKSQLSEKKIFRKQPDPLGEKAKKNEIKFINKKKNGNQMVLYEQQ